MKPLTKKEMYDKDGNCILPKYQPKKYKNRNKYIPSEEDKKHKLLIKV
jgi:hypothetical protein